MQSRPQCFAFFLCRTGICNPVRNISTSFSGRTGFAIPSAMFPPHFQAGRDLQSRPQCFAFFYAGLDLQSRPQCFRLFLCRTGFAIPSAMFPPHHRSPGMIRTGLQIPVRLGAFMLMPDGICNPVRNVSASSPESRNDPDGIANPRPAWGVPE